MRLRIVSVLLTSVLVLGCGPADVPARTESSRTRAPEERAPGPLVASLTAWDRADSQVREVEARRIAASLPQFTFDRLEHFECGGVAREVALFAHAATGLEFSLVPAGRAQLGPPGALQEVAFERPFLICRTETTWDAWVHVLPDWMERLPERAGTHPVENVDLADVERFLDVAGLALPSEAQWEYACRAGSVGAWCFGDDESRLHEYAWVEPHTVRHHPTVVAKLRPNAFGLFDVHGNVVERCADRPRPPGTPLTEKPNTTLGPPQFRVTRGGHVNYSTSTCWEAHRAGKEADIRFAHVGFRPVFVIGVDR